MEKTYTLSKIQHLAMFIERHKTVRILNHVTASNGLLKLSLNY